MNTKLKNSLLAAGLVISSSVSAGMTATDEDMSVTHIETKEEVRAKVLLAKAIEHIQKNGSEAVIDFNQKADFFDESLYVFALSIDGRFLASGGSSSVLVDHTVLDTFDMYGKYFFREMIQKARKDGQGAVEYHWKNPTDRAASPKRTLFQRVGDTIIAVGYYPVRANAFQAKELLGLATVEINENLKSALYKFNNLDGQYVNGDLYLFVIDTKTKLFMAHGVSRGLIGQSIDTALDEVGKEATNKMLEMVKHQDSGEISYIWTNPITNEKEVKHTFFRLVDGYLLGVGFYTPN
ncbi:MAG: cytochrome c [Shewanella sp.]|jgi:cytochrome c